MPDKKYLLEEEKTKLRNLCDHASEKNEEFDGALHRFMGTFSGFGRDENYYELTAKEEKFWDVVKKKDATVLESLYNDQRDRENLYMGYAFTHGLTMKEFYLDTPEVREKEEALGKQFRKLFIIDINEHVSSEEIKEKKAASMQEVISMYKHYTDFKEMGFPQDRNEKLKDDQWLSDNMLTWKQLGISHDLASFNFYDSNYVMFANELEKQMGPKVADDWKKDKRMESTTEELIAPLDSRMRSLSSGEIRNLMENWNDFYETERSGIIVATNMQDRIRLNNGLRLTELSTDRIQGSKRSSLENWNWAANSSSADLLDKIKKEKTPEDREAMDALMRDIILSGPVDTFLVDKDADYKNGKVGIKINPVSVEKAKLKMVDVTAESRKLAEKEEAARREEAVRKEAEERERVAMEPVRKKQQAMMNDITFTFSEQGIDPLKYKWAAEKGKFSAEQLSYGKEKFKEGFGVLFDEDQEKLLKKSGLNQMDCIFINGKSANELYGRKYNHDTEKMKAAVIADCFYGRKNISYTAAVTDKNGVTQFITPKSVYRKLDEKNPMHEPTQYGKGHRFLRWAFNKQPETIAEKFDKANDNAEAATEEVAEKVAAMGQAERKRINKPFALFEATIKTDRELGRSQNGIHASREKKEEKHSVKKRGNEIEQ